ncbi:DUF6261 family protein [Epilithonimonas mollis]|uniref:Uncharacterized protein n=1 Tax=Epilithonimonas mollis TaxID=216903 RepID=A0A1M6NYG6_9FLAO|nr:DUF6261 family protein [Epilithonimonas mollis]SHK00678.1 hypothetical protein SAMN05444371_0741 [Epilithonimonas mollis]
MKITLSELSTKDLATLTQRIISTADSGKYPVIVLHPLLAEIKAEYADYDKAYGKATFNGKGKMVADADAERDTAFRNLKKFLDGYKDMPRLPNHQMANELFQIIRKYGLSLDKMSYSSQTAQMKKLLEELEQPENQQKILALFLKTTIDDMKAQQSIFEELFAAQATANAELRLTKSASATRRALEKVLKSFLNLLTAMNNVAEWQLLYAEMNRLVIAAKNSELN